jgi:hypothetical protein
MSYPLCTSYPIEEIDLTGDSDTELSQTQVLMTLHPIKLHQKLTSVQRNPHSDPQVSIPNHRQHLLNKTTLWHRNSSGSVHTTEQLDPLQRKQGEAHSPGEGFEKYNEVGEEMIVMGKLKESLRRGGDAVNDMWAELGRANRLLDVAAMPSNDQNLYGLPTATRVILGDVRKSLRSIEKAQRESKKQVELLEPAVKALVSSPPAHPTIPHKAY